MSDIQPKRTIHEIRAEFQASSAAQLLWRIGSFELTLEVFKRNYRDFQKVMEAFLPEDVFDAFGMMTDASRVRAFLTEMLRPVHNFVASAATLIDHSRILYNELYSPGNLMPSYLSKIQSDFANDGVSQFIKNLRNYCTPPPKASGNERLCIYKPTPRRGRDHLSDLPIAVRIAEMGRLE